MAVFRNELGGFEFADLKDWGSVGGTEIRADSGRSKDQVECIEIWKHAGYPP
jgi:hypothetical protein